MPSIRNSCQQFVKGINFESNNVSSTYSRSNLIFYNFKASMQGPTEGLFRNILNNNAVAQSREDRLRRLQTNIEAVTTYGLNLSPRVSQLRSEYCRDLTFVLDSLARIGTELKSYPGKYASFN